MTELRAAAEGAEHSVRHFATDWKWLESAYPGTYPRRIVRGDGAYLIDDAGHATLDAGAHLGVCQIGHGRREVADAVAGQLAELEFVGLEAGFTHPLVAVVATRLRNLLPLEDPVISLCSSGSEANDLAFKPRVASRSSRESGPITARHTGACRRLATSRFASRSSRLSPDSSRRLTPRPVSAGSANGAANAPFDAPTRLRKPFLRSGPRPSPRLSASRFPSSRRSRCQTSGIGRASARYATSTVCC